MKQCARQMLDKINQQINELDAYYTNLRKSGKYTSIDRQNYYNQRASLYDDYEYYQKIMEFYEE